MTSLGTFMHEFATTPGYGSLVLFCVFFSCLACYVHAIRWVMAPARAEKEVREYLNECFFPSADLYHEETIERSASIRHRTFNEGEGELRLNDLFFPLEPAPDEDASAPRLSFAPVKRYAGANG